MLTSPVITLNKAHRPNFLRARPFIRSFWLPDRQNPGTPTRFRNGSMTLPVPSESGNPLVPAKGNDYFNLSRKLSIKKETFCPGFVDQSTLRTGLSLQKSSRPYISPLIHSAVVMSATLGSPPTKTGKTGRKSRSTYKNEKRKRWRRRATELLTQQSLKVKPLTESEQDWLDHYIAREKRRKKKIDDIEQELEREKKKITKLSSGSSNDSDSKSNSNNLISIGSRSDVSLDALSISSPSVPKKTVEEELKNQVFN
jgi:hypothetical protein